MRSRVPLTMSTVASRAFSAPVSVARTSCRPHDVMITAVPHAPAADDRLYSFVGCRTDQPTGDETRCLADTAIPEVQLPTAMLRCIRILLAVFLAALALGVASCGGPTATQPAQTSAPVAPTIPGSPSAAAPTPAQASWTMPDLIGTNLQDAQDAIQKLTDFGIVLTTSHDATGADREQLVDRNWKVCSQNIAPGATINASTMIDFGTVKIDESCQTGA